MGQGQSLKRNSGDALGVTCCSRITGNQYVPSDPMGLLNPGTIFLTVLVRREDSIMPASRISQSKFKCWLFSALNVHIRKSKERPNDDCNHATSGYRFQHVAGPPNRHTLLGPGVWETEAHVGSHVRS